ncbi:MAG: ABC transporter ATP-binding protein, partial [Bacteroidales bacterium]|nr:ABC transporter ATP-binding protein [Bacteroidales bacterium]
MKNLRKILQYLRNYKGNLTLVFIFTMLSVIFSLVSFAFFIPVFEILFKTKSVAITQPDPLSWDNFFQVQTIKDNFYYYTNSIIESTGPQTALLYIVIIIIVLFLLKNFFRYMESFCIAPIRNGVLQLMRNELYHKVLILPISYYSSKKKGDIITRLTSDVQEIENSVMGSLILIIREPVTILFYIITLLMMSPKLTCFAFILLPISGYVIGRISRTLKLTAKRGQSKMGGLISIIEESIDGLRIIKAFNAIDPAAEDFAKSNREYTKLMIKTYRIRDIATPLSEFFGVCVTVIAVWFGGSLVLSGNSLSAPVLIVYLAIFSQLLPPIKSITQAYYNIKKGAASMDRIEEVLQAEEVIVEKQDAIRKQTFDNSIEFKDVCFKYEDTDVLKHINLKIQKGQNVAIVGPSGAGKTTILNLIPRFYDCTSGEVDVDNIPIRDLRIDDLRNMLGIVTQDTILFNNSVAANIAFGIKDYNLDEVIRVAKIANAHDFIMELPDGYNTIIGDKGTKLSGGQKQRISIARALLKNPPILLLDEATSSLDTESEKAVHEALEKLMECRTSIVIA